MLLSCALLCSLTPSPKTQDPRPKTQDPKISANNLGAPSAAGEDHRRP
ncbi:hypothetical protein CGMCC3_g16535 [Colletotrichum fructicola]|nr:uncharacterized protein CGMCC3_g16535 [Colletotrichum fructicola]KAE9567358.1 hypothetical protein CGMCC3_g16535 [Colletotrichum fructicola]